MSSRAFPNPFPDHDGELVVDESGKLIQEFSRPLKENLSALITQLQAGLHHVRKDDFSVYTGQTGIALLYLHLYHTLQGTTDCQTYLETAIGYLQPALQHLGSGVYTFMCGDAGTLAVAAVAYARLGDKRFSMECVGRLEEMHSVIIKDTGIPDEHLYGRAGYLAAVMFVQSHLGDDVIHTDIIRKVVKAMLASGQALSHKKEWKPPLMYAWHREYYLGAAHGLAGIFYTLLLV